jgi:hypothetical protein
VRLLDVLADVRHKDCGDAGEQVCYHKLLDGVLDFFAPPCFIQSLHVCSVVCAGSSARSGVFSSVIK